MGVQAGAITASGTTTISGLGGRPRCILFLGTNQTVYESAFVATQGGGFIGFATEDADETIHNYCEFAILTTGRNSNLTQRCARVMHTAGSVFNPSLVLYEATVTAITDSSFTIDFTTGSASHQIHYLAIWDIEPGYVFPWETNCDGDNFVVDVGFEPAFFVALGNWRDNCHTFPKSTSDSLWFAASFGDVRAASTSMGSVAAQSVITGQFSSFTWTPPSASAPLGGVADPFILGSICTGLASYGKVFGAGNETKVVADTDGCGGGVGWITAQFSQCFIGDCREGYNIGGGALDSETAITFPRATPPEAVILCNFQSHTNGAGLNARKRWGFGFATPDYQAGFSINEADGSFFQSAFNAWVARTTGATWSGGEVTFTPVSGDIGLVVKSNGAGNGNSGVMGIKTSCPQGQPMLVSFSGFFQNRPSGSQLTLRGGVFIDGEGEPA